MLSYVADSGAWFRGLDYGLPLERMAAFVRHAATSIVGALMGITSVIWVALRNEPVVPARLCWLFVLHSQSRSFSY